MIIVEEGGIPPSWPAHQLPAPQPPLPGIPPATALKPPRPENAIRNAPATFSGSGAMSGIQPQGAISKQMNPSADAKGCAAKNDDPGIRAWWWTKAMVMMRMLSL